MTATSVVAPGPGQLLRSPFIRLDSGGGETKCWELVSGQRDSLTGPEIALLESCADGRATSALSEAEQALAHGLVARWLLLDTAAWSSIRRLSFDIVDLEVAGACNAECVFCPREPLRKGRGVGIMKRDAFYEIASKLAGNVSTFGLVGIGEPTLNKNLLEFVRHLKGSSARVMMITNGSMLTEALVDDLIEAGLDVCLVSFTGMTKQGYEQNMVGLDFERVHENVLMLARKARGRMPITLLAVATADNQGDLDGYAQYWAQRGVPAKVEPCHSRGGTVTELTLLRAEPAGAVSRCGYVSARSFVSWDGNVHVCCHDIGGTAWIGSLLDDDLDTLIDRKLEIIAGQTWFDICRQCDEKERLKMLKRGPRR